MPTLTAVTSATNEEARLARALRSVQGLADEIVVVDGGSTDRTVEIARQFTDKVFVNPWPGYGKQKNFALDRAAGDWVLFVDADEEVTPQLAQEIKDVIRQPSSQLRSHAEAAGRRISAREEEILRSAQDDKRTCYFVRIITVFLGRPLRHLWGTNPRLLRRGAVRWDDREVHEQVTRTPTPGVGSPSNTWCWKPGSTLRLGDPDVGILSTPLMHPSHYDTLAAYKEKRERYTSRDALEMIKTGHDRFGQAVPKTLHSQFSILNFMARNTLKQFLRLSLKKRGFLDGWRGCLWIWLSTEYEVMVARKYLALLRERRKSA